MTRPVLSLSALLLCSISAAQAEVITPHHLQQIEELHRQADKLAFGGIGSSNYHLAKARTWLNFALSEYYAMDSSGIVSAATGQAGALLDALEQNNTGIPVDAPLQIQGSEVVRPDLWDRIAALKSNAHFSCGQRNIAEAEVHLVWAGHEKTEYGWSHAESYARTAENLADEAQIAIDNCAEASLVAATQPHVVEKITQSGDALFEFGKAALNSYSLWRIDKFVDTIKGLASFEGVELVGHTDHLSKNGKQEFNLRLSKKRAESIKQYLVAKGVPADKIHASGVGASQPLTKCPAKLSIAKKIACLKPNRRVEITLHGVK